MRDAHEIFIVRRDTMCARYKSPCDPPAVIAFVPGPRLQVLNIKMRWVYREKSYRVSRSGLLSRLLSPVCIIPGDERRN